MKLIVSIFILLAISMNGLYSAFLIPPDEKLDDLFGIVHESKTVNNGYLRLQFDIEQHN